MYYKETWVLHHHRWPGAFAEPLGYGQGQLFPSFTGLRPLWHCFGLGSKVIEDTLLWCLLLFHTLVVCLVPSFQMVGQIGCTPAILDLPLLLVASVEAEHTMHVALVDIITWHPKLEDSPGGALCTVQYSLCLNIAFTTHVASANAW